MNAINWMIKKADVEVLEDGTVQFFFSGTLPRRMADEIKAAATASRVSPKSTTYSASDDLTSWAASFGAYKSTANTVKFSYTDYTIPAGA